MLDSILCWKFRTTSSRLASYYCLWLTPLAMHANNIMANIIQKYSMLSLTSQFLPPSICNEYQISIMTLATRDSGSGAVNR